MILNPNKQRGQLEVFNGTRLLVQDFGLTGVTLADPLDKRRMWTIQNIFQPIGRCLGGIRARCVDQKGFVSFIDQMSLEVLLGLGIPGYECTWADQMYPDPRDSDWFGFCVDPVDMIDDLYVRELLLRTEMPLLPAGLEMQRLVHVDRGNDVQDLFHLLWDGDRESGITPDVRMDTIESRWVRIEREKVWWSRM